MVDLKELADALTAGGIEAHDRTFEPHPNVYLWFPSPEGFGGASTRYYGTSEDPALCFAMIDVLRRALAYWESQPFDAMRTPNRGIAKGALRGWLMRPWLELTTETLALVLIEAHKASLLEELRG